MSGPIATGEAAAELIVEADGGSRGNPGVAGAGALVRDPVTGAVLAERAEPLGRASNNVAEYTGLILGLQAAARINPSAAVAVRMDSRLVVEQMSGRWKIKHQDMKRLAEQARELVTGFTAAGGSVTLQWVPRAQNAAADALSNAAMDGRSIDRTGTVDGTPPDTGTAEETVPPADTGTAGGTASLPDAGATDAPPPPAAELSDSSAPPYPSVAPGPADRAARAPGPADRAARAPGPADRAAAPVPRPLRVGAPADLGSATRVVLVRHGVTDYTTAGRLDGRGGCDPQLNAEGQRQARAAARGVHAFLGDAPVRVLSSSLSRAMQTGQLLAAALDCRCQVDPDWDELSFGDWDGRYLADIHAEFPTELAQAWQHDDVARPGGESRTDLRNRVVAALQRAVTGATTVVVATHRGPILAVLSHLLGATHRQLAPLATAPASMTSLRLWPDGGVQVEFVNDTSHLR